MPFRDAVVRSLFTLRCSPTHLRARPSPRRRPRCPKSSAASATGTIDSRGPATRASASAHFSASASTTKHCKFLAWLRHASRLDRPRLPVLLTLHGKRPRPERALDDWPGYADSRPVRMGNGAADQHQLDGYGWVLDAAWLLTDAGHRLDSETWRAVAGFADHVAQHWREPDAGSGRSVATRNIMCIPSSWRGSASIARCASPKPAASRRGGGETGRRNETRSARNCSRAASTRQGAATRARTIPTTSTRPCSSFRLSESNRPTQPGFATRSTRSRANSPPAARSSTGIRPVMTDSPAPRAHSCLARSGWSRHWPMTGRLNEATDRFAALVELASPLGLFAEETRSRDRRSPRQLSTSADPRSPHSGRASDP